MGKTSNKNLTAFKPAFSLAQMEAFWAIGTHMAPTTFFPMWALQA
jgi:hypothetical protein